MVRVCQRVCAVFRITVFPQGSAEQGFLQPGKLTFLFLKTHIHSQESLEHTDSPKTGILKISCSPQPWTFCFLGSKLHPSVGQTVVSLHSPEISHRALCLSAPDQSEDTVTLKLIPSFVCGRSQSPTLPTASCRQMRFSSANRALSKACRLRLLSCSSAILSLCLPSAQVRESKHIKIKNSNQLNLHLPVPSKTVLLK